MNTAKKDRFYSDLLEACERPGCPLCRISRAFMHSYMDATLYERVNDYGVRAALREARGYCNTHAWMLADRHGVVLGAAIMQRDVLNTLLRELDDVPIRKGARQTAQDVAQRLRPTTECPACIHRREMDDLAITTLLKYLGDARLSAALERTSGLCIPHFTRALDLVEDQRQLDNLVRFQREALHRLSDELSELIRKHDYRFMSEGFGDEGDSWLRATGIVSGEHGAV